MDIPLCLELSRRTGRPVQMTMSYAEELMAAAPRHASVTRVRVGVSRDGRLQAMDVHAIFNAGAYGAFRPSANFGARTATSYRIPAIRAVAEDREMAAVVGVNVRRVIAVTFFLGSALAGAGGVLVGLYYTQIDFFMGYSAGLKAFTAAVLGGIGNIRGAMLGGLLLGLIESLAVTFINPAYKDVVAFAVLIVTLVVRPTGLLGDEPARRLRDAVESTNGHGGFHVNVAVGYGGRQEIVDAVRALLGKELANGATGEQLIEAVTAEAISENLYTSGQPDPDLVIRTSGEQRLSGFLLWQSAYSEMWFTEAYWPEFRRVDFLRALRDFAARHRRFGG